MFRIQFFLRILIEIFFSRESGSGSAKKPGSIRIRIRNTGILSWSNSGAEPSYSQPTIGIFIINIWISESRRNEGVRDERPAGHEVTFYWIVKVFSWIRIRTFLKLVRNSFTEQQCSWSESVQNPFSAKNTGTKLQNYGAGTVGVKKNSVFIFVWAFTFYSLFVILFYNLNYPVLF